MSDDLDRSQFLITERRCKICTSPLRGEIDARVLGDVRDADDRLFTYEDVVAWAAERGEQITASSLSRHRSNHLQPSVMMALETQKYMDAMAKATGRKLSIHSAVANVIATKTLRQLDDIDVKDMDPEKLLRVALRAAEVSLKIEQAELMLTPQVVEQIDQKLVAAGLQPETLAQIRELYGLTP
jgi:hypothetical protein